MPFDIFILVILLFTTIRGAAKGVAWQLAGIGALVLCFLFATPLSLAFAPMIKLAPPLNRWVAMLAIYLVFSFGTFSIARGFRSALEKAKFVEFDRHMGALFGLAKGAIIALVITFFAVAMSEKTREYVLTTYTGYAAAHIMDAIDPVMPKELHTLLEPYIHKLDAVDPELERRREENHQDLGEADPDEPGPDPRRIRGYQPLTGNQNDPSESLGDPFQNDAEEPPPPGYTSKRPRQPAPAEPTFTEEAQQLLESLPGLVKKMAPSIKQQILKAVENTLAEHREELVDELSEAKTAENISKIAKKWESGRPRRPVADPQANEDSPLDPFGSVPQARPVPRVPGRPKSPAFSEDAAEEVATVDLKPRRQELLQGIARIFSSQPAQQAKKMTEIETALLGLPDPVAVGALDDWLSDLSGEGTDPDPETNVATQLNLRIARQVDQQQIPHTRLSPEWQTRLERYLRN